MVSVTVNSNDNNLCLKTTATGAALLGVLLLTRLHGYLLFHSLVEIFCAVYRKLHFPHYVEHPRQDRQSLHYRHRHRRSLRRKSEEKFSIAFRSNPSILWLADLDENRFVDVTDAFEKATGW